MDDAPQFSRSALVILKRLAHRGGCMRIGSLLRECAVPYDDFCVALDDLSQRRHLKIAWRATPHACLPACLRHVVRVTLTRFGRSRVPVPWLYPDPREGQRRRRRRGTGRHRA
jgi:hypothetical protein